MKKRKAPPSPDKTASLSFLIHNLGRHLDETFDLWHIKNPSLKIRLQRSLIFVSSLFVVVIWPIDSLTSNILIILLAWIILALTDKPVNRWLLMFNMQLNIAWLFYLVNAFLNLLK